MPYEKEEDERSENQNLRRRGGGMKRTLEQRLYNFLRHTLNGLYRRNITKVYPTEIIRICKNNSSLTAS